MRRWILPLALGSLALLPAACDDPAGPCAPAFACEIEGVDLFVDELEILADERDPSDGRGVIEAGLASVRVRVRNRGTEPSPPAPIALGYGTDLGSAVTFPDTLSVPGLPPGGTWEGRTTLLTWDGGPGDPGDATGYATAELVIADADTANNRLVSEPVYVRLSIVSRSADRARPLRPQPRRSAAAPAPRPSSSLPSRAATTPRGSSPARRPLP